MLLSSNSFTENTSQLLHINSIVILLCINTLTVFLCKTQCAFQKNINSTEKKKKSVGFFSQFAPFYKSLMSGHSVPLTYSVVFIK